MMHLYVYQHCLCKEYAPIVTATLVFSLSIRQVLLTTLPLSVLWSLAHNYAMRAIVTTTDERVVVESISVIIPSVNACSAYLNRGVTVEGSSARVELYYNNHFPNIHTHPCMHSYVYMCVCIHTYRYWRRYQSTSAD